MQENDLDLKDLSNAQVLCVYGQGDEKFFCLLKKWLKKNEERRLIFLEDEKQKHEQMLLQTKQFLPSQKIKHVLI